MTNQARQTRDSIHSSLRVREYAFSPAAPLFLQKLVILSGGPPCLGFVVPGISLRLPLRWRSFSCPRCPLCSGFGALLVKTFSTAKFARVFRVSNSSLPHSVPAAAFFELSLSPSDIR